MWYIISLNQITEIIYHVSKGENQIFYSTTLLTFPLLFHNIDDKAVITVKRCISGEGRYKYVYIKAKYM